MADYKFVTTWVFKAPLQTVWDALTEPERWPEWWEGLLSVVTIQPGDAYAIGREQEYVWKSKLPYKLSFVMRAVEFEPYKRIVGQAVGELEGKGTWELSHNMGVTSVVYTWEVKTTQAWMNLLAPLARPLFSWNHHVLMEAGGRGLAQYLGVELVEARAGAAS